MMILGTLIYTGLYFLLGVAGVVFMSVWLKRNLLKETPMDATYILVLWPFLCIWIVGVMFMKLLRRQVARLRVPE
jgi:Na+/proline symporter